MTGDVRGGMDEVVRRNVEIKAAVVGEDEKERGKRKLLNFGHTLGHGVTVPESFPGVMVRFIGRPP